MTEQRANEIFRTKNPTGCIYRKNSTSAESKYWVQFTEHGKVYYYSAESYAALLNRLGFKVAYKHDLKAAEENVERYENKLNAQLAGDFDLFDLLFGTTAEEAIAQTRELLADAQKQLERLNSYIIE